MADTADEKKIRRWISGGVGDGDDETLAAAAKPLLSSDNSAEDDASRVDKDGCGIRPLN